MSRPECGETEGKMVLCPFWKAFGADSGWSWIRCESHVPDSEIVEIRFRNIKQRDIQKETFCKGCYKRCEHYRSNIHMKWQDEE